MTSQIPENIGSYRIINIAGCGSYGIVYLAENILSGQKVALKVVNAADKVRSRELNGLIRFRACKHPNLLQIFHVDKFEDRFYYTMEPADDLKLKKDCYIPDTLGTRMENNINIPSEQLYQTALQISDALKYLHANGLIHRDIKPDNIIFINSNAILSDIGLLTDGSGKTLIGTPEFMPPELLRHEREISPDDDLYALSRVLYCAMTGRKPADFPSLPDNILQNPVNAKLWQLILQFDKGNSNIDSGVKEDKLSYFKWKYVIISFAVLLFLLLFMNFFSNKKFHPPAPPAQSRELSENQPPISSNKTTAPAAGQPADPAYAVVMQPYAAPPGHTPITINMPALVKMDKKQRQATELMAAVNLHSSVEDVAKAIKNKDIKDLRIAEHAAAIGRFDLVELLLSNGAVIHDDRILYEAVIRNDAKALKMLLAHGANPFVTVFLNETLYDKAENCPEVQKTLFEAQKKFLTELEAENRKTAPVNPDNMEIAMLLSKANKIKNAYYLRYELASKNYTLAESKIDFILQSLYQRNNLEILKVLLDYNAKISDNGHYISLIHDPECLDFLMQNGLKVSQMHFENFILAKANSEQLAPVVFKHGFKINKPRHRSVLAKTKDHKTLEVLLKNGVIPEKRDVDNAVLMKKSEKFIDLLKQYCR